MKKISVIIPCYNAEQYIDQCIKSLVNQTIGIENLELIFVNDASTDGTLDRLKEWEQNYSESILIVDCKENGKQGKARNIGLSYATAEYIGFIDNDDIAELTMYEKLYNKMTEFDCDMAVCYSKRHTIKETVFMGETKKEDKLLIIHDENREMFLKKDINRAVWNKLYKRDIIINNEICFPEGGFYEDIYFSELIKHYVNRVYILEEYLYHHIVHKNATSLGNNMKLYLGYFEVNVEKILELKRRGLYQAYHNLYEEEFLIDFYTFLKTIVTRYHVDSSYLNSINKIVRQVFPNYLEIPLISNIKNNLVTGQWIEFYKLVIDYLDKDLTEEDIDYLYKVVEQIVKEVKKGIKYHRNL